MANLSNLARMYTSTVGSGSFVTLTTAVAGCLTFAQSNMIDGLTYSYGITDGVAAETGRGVFDSSGSKITRSVLNSTNSGSLISLSGSAEIYVSALAQDFEIPFSGSAAPAGTNYVGQLWWDTTDVTLSAQGPRGLQGATGEKGDTGPQGEKGDIGLTGPGSNIRVFTWNVVAPAVGGIPGQKLNEQHTATRISSYSTTTNGSVVFNIEHRAIIGTSGCPLLSGSQIATTSGSDATVLQNTTMIADRWLWLNITSVSGSPASFVTSLATTV
jgi:hypothetical protein